MVAVLDCIPSAEPAAALVRAVLWVSAELDRAGLTLMSLPGRDLPGGQLRSGHPEIVRDKRESYGFGQAGARAPLPTSADISQMDRVLGWLTELPNDQRQLRGIVGRRMLIHPISRKRVHSWREIGVMIGASHKTAMARYDDALFILAKKNVTVENFASQNHPNRASITS